MVSVLTHRGPDSAGVWEDRAARVWMGHRRLSVVDLSASGAQPMVSSNGRWVLTYNGELYNAVDLRAELSAQGVVFRGSSDTEVLLEAIAGWGLHKTLRRINGMFAFAVWDREQRSLFLARDRLGIKPLYWAQTTAGFLFGSELRSLEQCDALSPSLDTGSAALFMRYGYVPAPRTIWKEVSKLAPGTVLHFRVGGAVDIEHYWRLQDVVDAARTEPWQGSIDEAVDELDSLLSDAISRQMVADVPLGAFLSGGIDSSLVVAMMQSASARPVSTFSIGFHEQGYNEAEHAGAVARHLGTRHTEAYVTSQDAVDALPTVLAQYDEPFADSSQIPTYLVSHLARQQVKVVLSGDGGDESFAGYSRYSQTLSLMAKLHRGPKRQREFAARQILLIPAHRWDALAGLLPASLRPADFGFRMHRLAKRMQARNATGLYAQTLSLWQEPAEVVACVAEPGSLARDPALERAIPAILSRMQYIDSMSYLPDDILTKVDRASMAVSLECRVPLLDHRIVEFAWHLPEKWRQRGGVGKWLLRQVLYRYVPPELIDRPKMGFGVPIADWLRGPLKEWAGDLLNPAAIERHGVLKAAPVDAAWRAHQSGERNQHYPLWAALVLQDWLGRR